MKKHLIAAAVAAAVAVPAIAQVSVSGRLDQSFGTISAVGADNGVGSDSTQFVASSILFTNFLRFSGSEDLGGGLKASFVLETNIGAHSNGDTSAPFSFGDRGAELSVMGAFGGISIGKAQNSDINIINSGPTNATNLTASGADPATNPRPSNRVLFTSPAFEGVTVRIGYATNANDAGAEALLGTTKGNGRYQSFGLTYSKGPLNFTIAQAKINLVVAALTSDTTDQGARASYNFGVATVQVAYLATSSSPNALAEVNLTAMSVDVAVPLGNGLTAHLGAVSNDNEVVANRTASADRYSLTLRKELSKRTSFYGTYAAVNNGTTGVTTAISTLGAPGAGRAQAALFTGLVHTF